MLLDTTFFIDLADELQARQSGPCQTFLRTHRHLILHVSVVTLGEFAVGATEAETKRFFRGYRPVALGRQLAIFAGRLQASLNFELGENDLWIAATGIYHKFPVVTRDHAFARVRGLHVISY